MGEVTDFTLYRKKKKRKKLIRTLVCALLICGVTYGMSLLLYESGADDMEGALAAVLGRGDGESRFPVNSPGGEIKGMFSLGGSLAVLNDTNVYFYSSTGQLTGTIQHRYQTPVARAAKGKFLLYDQGGKQYALYNKDKLVREGNTNDTIYLGDISGNGDYVIASKGELLTQVTFYQANGSEVFSWESTDKLVTAIRLSHDGKRLAVGCAHTEGGRLISTVVLLDTVKMAVTSSITLENELIVSLEQQKENWLVLSDQQAFICDTGGRTLHTYSFEGQPLCGFDANKDNIALLLGDFRHNRYYTLVSLNAGLTELGNSVVEQKVYGIENDPYGIYLLTGNRLQVLNTDTSWREEEDLQDIQTIYPMGHYLFAATSDRIYKLDFA